MSCRVVPASSMIAARAPAAPVPRQHHPAAVPRRRLSSRLVDAGASFPRRALRPVLAGLLVALLAACQTTPKVNAPGNVSNLPPGNESRDGPEAHPPSNLEAVPDAVPQIEPLRVGGPNKPYEVAGHTYVPLTDDRAVTEKGLASWYGKKFHGHRTASGEAYNMYAMTAAHKTLPIPSYARVRNPSNGHEVIVRVNDRGPFSPGRVIDLSYTAALKLGVLGGVQQVEISRITDDDIRTGAAFRRAPGYAAAAPADGAANAPPANATTTTIAVGDLDRPAVVTSFEGPRTGVFAPRRGKARPQAQAQPEAASQPDGTAAPTPSSPALVPPSSDGTATSTAGAHTDSQPGVLPAAGTVVAATVGGTVDLGSAAATDTASAAPGATSTVSTPTIAASGSVSSAGARPRSTSPPRIVLAADGSGSASIPAGVVLPPWPSTAPSGNQQGSAGSVVAAAAPVPPSPLVTPGVTAAAMASTPSPSPARADARDERARADTTAGVGYWIQLGAYKQRDGALEFQRRLIDEQPWLAPLLAVFSDHGLNKLQAGPYTSRDDAKSVAERLRVALQLVPTIVEKR